MNQCRRLISGFLAVLILLISAGCSESNSIPAVESMPVSSEGVFEPSAEASSSVAVNSSSFEVIAPSSKEDKILPEGAEYLDFAAIPPYKIGKRTLLDTASIKLDSRLHEIQKAERAADDVVIQYAFSPDGKKLAYLTYDGQINLLSLGEIKTIDDGYPNIIHMPFTITWVDNDRLLYGGNIRYCYSVSTGITEPILFSEIRNDAPHWQAEVNGNEVLALVANISDNIKGLLVFYDINQKQELKSLALELSVGSTNVAQPLLIHWTDNDTLYLAYRELMPGSDDYHIYSHCLSRYNIKTQEFERIFRSQYVNDHGLQFAAPVRPISLNSRWAIWEDLILNKIHVYDIQKGEWVYSLNDLWFHNLSEDNFLVAIIGYTTVEGYSKLEYHVYDLLGDQVYTIKEENLPEGFWHRCPLEVDREKLS